MITKTVFEVSYQWILENTENKPKILSSKMILFRGQEVFRVALKNAEEKQTLVFVAINFKKIGMKVREVFYSNQKLGNFMEPLIKQNNGNDTTLQVFSVDLKTRVSGTTAFNFHIRIEGTVTEFSYQLADRLLKNQLWMAVQNLQWTDINFIVQGKKISAHKCVLASRSSVFQKELANVGNVKQIIMNDVDFSTFEQFLYFLYTGETNKSLANEQLLKLAKRYCLTTLCGLCEIALGQIIAKEMVCCSLSLIPEKDTMLPVEIWPAKDTELYFDPKSSTCLLDWNFRLSHNQANKIKQEVFEYQNEKRFSTRVTAGNFFCDGDGYTTYVTNPTLRLVYVDNGNSNYQVVEAICSVKDYRDNMVFQRRKMERRIAQENGLVVSFLAPTSDSLQLNLARFYTISFRIKISSTVENYHYEMMDTTCAYQLWNATGIASSYLATMTDVEISVGSQKFEAHRVVLAARSPVFKAQLEKDNAIAKSSITVDLSVDSTIFQHFLEFLYTGTLKISTENKKLLALAEMYEVETLKKLCQTVNQEFGVDVVTSSLIALL